MSALAARRTFAIRLRTPLLGLLLGATHPLAAAAQPATAPSQFSVHPLGPRVVLFVGLGVGRANSVLVLGDTAAMLVDAQIAPSQGRALVREARAVTDLPIRHLVLTHWHVDHSHGAQGIVDALGPVEVLATQATVEALHSLAPAQLARALPFWSTQAADAALRIGRGTADPEGTARAMANDSVALREMGSPTWPRVSRVLEERAIDLGGVTVNLLPLSGHTAGDLLVHLASDGVLIAGDLFLPGRPVEPALERAEAAAAQRMSALPFRVLLLGHGPPIPRPERFGDPTGQAARR